MIDSYLSLFAALQSRRSYEGQEFVKKVVETYLDMVHMPATLMTTQAHTEYSYTGKTWFSIIVNHI